MSNPDDSEILQEILSSQRLILEKLENPPLSASPGAAKEHVRVKLNIFFTRNDGERKPYTLHIDGALKLKLNLSDVRTAIYLALFSRMTKQGNDAFVEDLAKQVVRLYSELREEEQSNDVSHNPARVALYRFDTHFSSIREFRTKSFALSYDHEMQRLYSTDGEGTPNDDLLDLDVSSDDPILGRVINRLFSYSPLELLYHRKALFLTPGADNYDRFQLELFDHRYPISTTTMSERFSTVSYPRSLLERTGASAAVLERNRIAAEKFASGKFAYTEVVHRDTLNKLIEIDSDGKYLSYPPGFSAQDVQSHLEYLQTNLRECESYELILTEAKFPFLIGAYQVSIDELPECYTMFFQNFVSDYLHETSCFVLSDYNIMQNVTKNVVEWVVTHPSSTRSKSKVIGEIEALKGKLK